MNVKVVFIFGSCQDQYYPSDTLTLSLWKDGKHGNKAEVLILHIGRKRHHFDSTSQDFVQSILFKSNNN